MDYKFKIGDATGFVCGVKPDHVCNDSGPIMALLADGRCIPQYDVERLDLEDEVRGGSVSCSICNEPFKIPNF